MRYFSVLAVIMISHTFTLYPFADRNDFIYDSVGKKATDETLQYVGITRVCCSPSMISIYKKSSSRNETKKAREMSYYSQNKFSDIANRFNTLVDAIKDCYTGSLWHLCLCAFKKKLLEIRSSVLQREMAIMLSKY